MNDPLFAFLSAPAEQRFELLKDPDIRRAAERYAGSDAIAELHLLAARVQPEHLAAKSPPNLVFVPGVMGSLLTSRNKGGVWWLDVLHLNLLNRLSLSEDGLSDQDPDDDIAPFNIDLIYQPFTRAILAREDFGHRSFAYDWRKPFSSNTAALRDLIVSMRKVNGNKPVHIVAHSMGGLMVRAALMEFEQELKPLTGRIVFVGTPHYGAPAIAGYLKNHLWGFELLALMGTFLSRETFRSLWGVLSLLPAPAGIYPGTRQSENPRWKASNSEDWFYEHPCSNFDLYQVKEWDLGLNGDEAHQLQSVLDGAAAFHRQIYEWHAGLDPELLERMLVIAGVGYKGLFRLAYRTRAMGLWNTMQKTTERISGDPHRDGDGRVPRASADLEGVQHRYIKGVHGGLTNIPAVYQDVFHFLRGEDLELPKTPAAALATHLAGDVLRSESPHLDGTYAASDDDPGYLQDVGLNRERILELQQSIEHERSGEFHSVRIL
jgi:pimeloyl-ACP methyl ester carboxylesterase